MVVKNQMVNSERCQDKSPTDHTHSTDGPHAGIANQGVAHLRQASVCVQAHWMLAG